MDRLTATKVFVTVVDQGSLTQAAEHLDMTTAMVSRYVAALENWLDARLLHRTTRRISLTEAGQAALPSCRQLLEAADDIQHQAGTLSRTPRGRLRITSSSSFAESQLAPAVVEFQRQYPEVEVTLTAADRNVDLTAERIDLALRITNSLEPTHIARRLTVCRSVLCAAPEYLATHGKPKTLNDLKQHLCLSHALVGATKFRFVRKGKPVEVDVQERFSTNETAILRSAVLAGAGIGVLPTYYVSQDLKSGRLAPLLPEYEPGTLGIYAILLSRQHQPLALRLLLDFLIERFGDTVPIWDR